jgi:hypothetical protein
MNDFTPHDFPFKTTLNLRLLIEYWEKSLQNSFCSGASEEMLAAINATPELKLPIENEEVLERNKSIIDFLMSAIVAPAFAQSELTAAIVPFQFKSIFSTPAFDRAIDFNNLHSSVVHISIPDQKLLTGKIMKACTLILNKFYDANISIDKPLLITVKDPVTDLDKTYKMEINDRFCEIIAKREPRPIDKKVIKFLTDKLYDTDLWLSYIHPEDFEFRGFMVMRLIDVSEQEMLSSIKFELLKKNSVTEIESFNTIQHKLRSIFRIADLRLGVAYFDPNDNLVISSGLNSWQSVCEHEVLKCGSYENSIYDRAWTEKRHIAIENLEDYPFQGPIEQALLKNGIKGILLAPMIDDNQQVIGMLELATEAKNALTPISASRIENVLPMFTAAVKRVKEEMSTEVRALIQEECTTIHPTVQWRFFEAGLNLMNKRRAGISADFEEISFKEIYPLFGMVDVRNSSLERNAAIQKDLQHNLKLAKDALQKISDKKKLPLLDELAFRTEEQLKKIAVGMASGDESNVLDFLKHEVNPIIRHFTNDAELGKWVTRYNNHLDEKLDVVYRRRKAFEDSLGAINKTINGYLDEAQQSAQSMFPHYFEKYQTDGVEFTLYLGTSLVKNQVFDPFFLKNFRLWQLLLMCDIDRKMEELKPQLKNQLEITQLILVHDQPISIRFRPDEKQFDVDGAYDIRYEIVKKRIDKAYIKNTSERLTQPGKIAIVYNQNRVEEEYKRYVQYLISKKIISPEVEELELEELPGANGLKALRIQMARVENNAHTPNIAENVLKGLEAAMNA